MAYNHHAVKLEQSRALQFELVHYPPHFRPPELLQGAMYLLQVADWQVEILNLELVQMEGLALFVEALRQLVCHPSPELTIAVKITVYDLILSVETASSMSANKLNETTKKFCICTM
jgi:hypothetical protein